MNVCGEQNIQKKLTTFDREKEMKKKKKRVRIKGA
jgi:hypothetical protein